MRNEHLVKHRITVNGETKPLTEWARYYNIEPQTIRKRIERGVPEEHLLDPPRPAVREANPQWTGGIETAYTEEELYAMYKKFAEEPDALRTLADFMGVPTCAEAKPLYEKFKKRRKAERR